MPWGSLVGGKHGASVLARATAFTPASLPGLQLWLKADAIPGKSDGDAIATWADQSGHSRDASQATGAKRPLYKVVSGVPEVRFDGVNDVLDLAASSLAACITASAYTVFAVFRATGQVGNTVYDNDAIFAQGTNGNWQTSISSQSGGKAQFYHDDGGIQTDQDDLVSDAWYVLTGVYDGANLNLKLNARATVQKAAGNLSDTTGYVRIGANYSASHSILGAIRECGICNVATSPSNLTALRAALGAKYGITVA